MQTPDFGTKETILCHVFSSCWNQDMPATLIEYADGSLDLHIQTGDHYDLCLEKAKRVLLSMGMKVVSKDEMIGPTGVYHTVTRINNEKI